ncbi:MAG: hypothetical protein EBV73_01650 [Rhodocyclales bacterium]|nr:hypothetical protein [Rhodocyclales bacterium]
MHSKAVFVTILVLSAIIVSAMNVAVLGSFIGKAATLHPDVNSIKERGAARAVVVLNGIICLTLLFAALGFAFYAGIGSCSDHTRKHGFRMQK